MLYYSTQHNSPKVDFKTATVKGLAPDGGLYFPESIPKLPKELIENIGKYSNDEIAYQVIAPYIGNLIPEDDLRKIVNETISFDFLLVKLNDDVYSLELFHGPTLAFKDVGARFMSRCLGYFVKNLNKQITVLVATSGDTGGAVADGFYNVEGIEVVILYPKGKVSPIQELQLTTHGKNIKAIAINGTFDDCQHMVKKAFADEDLNAKLFLTSANSINVARWLPQQFYYFFALKQWDDLDHLPVISVPSGNFGNICAGLLAYSSGLPVKHFIAACNINDVVPKFFKTGIFSKMASVSTISNAMDVGNPSNFVRILELYDQDISKLKTIVSSYSFSDEETKQAIQSLYTKYSYISDPHGAVGFLGLQKYLSDHKSNKGIFLETAHPIKFPEVVESVINIHIPVPDSVNKINNLKNESINMGTDYEELKNYLIEN